jgi:hypothetical protein
MPPPKTLGELPNGKLRKSLLDDLEELLDVFDGRWTSSDILMLEPYRALSEM